MADRIDPVSIVDETRRRYLNYALSVITSRALPDVRDGLKPVQRRILYNMYHDLHLYADGRPVKCARVCGDVMANYHPHGDAAIYDALVRMAQPFVLRYPLIHGEGNFGSVDGLEPASFRYTECKLLPIAEELLAELKQRTVEMRPNYDGSKQEPIVLPARFPNLLVNGVAGIAVGMATNIPPHNLAEVIRGALLLIDDRNATTPQLLDRIKGPDFPLGGRVLAERRTLRSIYEEGTGSIKVQGEWKVEEAGRKRQIVITSIPYGVNRAALEESIGTIIAERKLPQLTNLINESNEREGTRIVLEMKQDADPEMIMAYLFKHTALQQNFAYNMTCLVPVADQPGKLIPRRLGLRDMLLHFLDFRFETVKRRFQFELEQLRQRIHILEGFRIIFNDLDKALRLIRESQGKQDAAERLMKTFKLDEVQADAILEMLLYKIAQLEIRKILQELKEKKEQARQIEEILRSERKLWGVVKKELEEIAEKFGDRRRTRIVSEEETLEFDPEAYIARENTNVVVTRDGWIKRVARLQSVESTRVREGDAVLAVVPGSTLDHVVFFSDDGVAFTMRIHEVPASSGYGEPISKFFRLGEGARIVAALPTDPRFVPPEGSPTNGEPPPPYLIIVTAQGQVLRLPFAPFRSESTVRGRQYVRLGEGDKVVFVQLQRDERSIFLASESGHVIHFPLDQINILSGVGKGVVGIKLDDGDRCLGAALIRNQNDALVVETTGEKRMEFYGSRETTSRGGRGIQAVKRTQFVRVVPPPIQLVNWDELEAAQNA
ncbi:MAG: DNA topoisomerase IV subunit A [Gemmatales bacterium]|nr:DNA topoisomerase IV subunit A [Gemmatales bacterium]MDW8386741.1 DNA topoisomerase IV subunit A [Gemmatales bacterium]